MLAEIEYFIDSFFIEDNKKIILESLDILEDLEIEYSNALISIMMAQGDMDNAKLIDDFRNNIENTITEALKLHGVVLSEEANLDFKNKILHSIINLAFYENKEDLSAILESSEEPNYKFSELIDHVCELDLMAIFSKIESVDPNIFSKLSQILNRSMIKIDESELEKQSFRNNIISKLKDIKAFTKYDKALGFTLVNSNIILGSDFNQYASYADKHFEYLNIDETAIEVFVLLTMSKEGFEQPLITFRKYSQNLFSDLDKITKVDVKLNHLVLAYEKYVVENKKVEVNA